MSVGISPVGSDLGRLPQKQGYGLQREIAHLITTESRVSSLLQRYSQGPYERPFQRLLWGLMRLGAEGFVEYIDLFSMSPRALLLHKSEGNTKKNVQDVFCDRPK
jgi:hypothetical protein